MKKILFLLILFVSVAVYAEQMPDNVFFRAMKDEMDRSMKGLQLKDQPKLFFMFYEVEEREKASVSSFSFGVDISPDKGEEMSDKDTSLQVYMQVGDQYNSSSEYEVENPSFLLGSDGFYGSYESLRQEFWELTDLLYKDMVGIYRSKQNAKRKRNLKTTQPDFSAAPLSHYIEPIKKVRFHDKTKVNHLLRQLSAEGKKYPFILDYHMTFSQECVNKYYLNSEGSFYQTSYCYMKPFISLSMLTRDGKEERLMWSKKWKFNEDWDKWAFLIRNKSEEMLHLAQVLYDGKDIQRPYQGPVLLDPSAARNFFLPVYFKYFVKTKPLLSSDGTKIGVPTTEKIGWEILSEELNVFSFPHRKFFEDDILDFQPIDLEGVWAEDLTLVEKGKLINVPLTRSFVEGQTKSNGHGFRLNNNNIQSQAVNIMFDPIRSFPRKLLEEKFMEICKEKKKEFCYMIYQDHMERVYSADGRREVVHNAAHKFVDDSVLAFGDDLEVVRIGDTPWILPSVLLEKVEILPSDSSAKNPSPVPRPKP